MILYSMVCYEWYGRHRFNERVSLAKQIQSLQNFITQFQYSLPAFRQQKIVYAKAATLMSTKEFQMTTFA